MKKDAIIKRLNKRSVTGDKITLNTYIHLIKKNL